MDILNNFKLSEDSMELDVDSLPDMDRGMESQFVDIAQERLEISRLRKQERALPKEELYFRRLSSNREGDRLWVRFDLTKTDRSFLLNMSDGLLSTRINEGNYLFSIQEALDGTEELYFYDDYVGEIIDNKPVIFTRYFAQAVMNSLVEEGILVETEKGKYVINPAFFIRLQLNPGKILEDLQSAGYAMEDLQELENARELQQTINDIRSKIENQTK